MTVTESIYHLARRNEPRTIDTSGQIGLAPSSIRHCESTTVSAIESPVILAMPLDVVVVFDVSMRRFEWAEGIEHVRRVVNATISANPIGNRAAIVVHKPSVGHAQRVIGFTNDLADLLRAVGRIEMGSDMQHEGIKLARRTHTDDRLRNDVLRGRVVVVIGDGGQIASRGANEFEASKTREAGIRILVLCAPSLGLCDNIRGIVATSADYFQYAPPDVGTASRALIQRLLARRIVSASLEHRLAPIVTSISGSAVPPPSYVSADGNVLRWNYSEPVPASVTATYRIAPRVDLYRGPAVTATLTVTDDLGVVSIASVATADIEITGPCITPPTPTTPPTASATPSPTPSSTATGLPTATATPSPTPEPGPIYLPLALVERCDPTQQRIDVALVIDASTSMSELTRAGRPKIAAALSAAHAFLDLLRLDPLGDQAAIVTFNSGAWILAPLTSDRSGLDAALDAVSLGQQTRLDRAVAVGAQALADSSRRRMGNEPVLVLLTDGRANPVPIEAAVAEAELAKAAGVTVYTIGLGEDIDAEGLAAMASMASGFLRASDAEDLAAVYAQVARSIPCPASAWWVGR